MQSPGVVGERQILSSPGNMAAVSKSDSDARAALFLRVRNKCGKCQHPRILHDDGKCSVCGCVAKARIGNVQPLRMYEVYGAVVEGAKYHPDGIRLNRLIFIVARHNKGVYDYFQIAKYGQKVWGIFPAQNYRSISNGRYQKFRKAILNGKVPDLGVKALLPDFIVYYSGEGIV